MKRVLIFMMLISFAGLVFAGSVFEGWGNTPSEAQKEALDTATKNSGGGCLCKDWNMDMERDCKQSLGGFICKACGSNHVGSCKKGTEVSKYYDDLKKLKELGK